MDTHAEARSLGSNGNQNGRRSVNAPRDQHTAGGSDDGRGRREGGEVDGNSPDGITIGAIRECCRLGCRSPRHRRHAATARRPPRRPRRPQRQRAVSSRVRGRPVNGLQSVGRISPPSSKHSLSCLSLRRPPRRQRNWPPRPGRGVSAAARRPEGRGTSAAPTMTPATPPPARGATGSACRPRAARGAGWTRPSCGRTIVAAQCHSRRGWTRGQWAQWGAPHR